MLVVGVLFQFKFVAMVEAHSLVRQPPHFGLGLVVGSQGLMVEPGRVRSAQFGSHHRGRHPLGQFRWKSLFRVEWLNR